jgi:hypothetical protein
LVPDPDLRYGLKQIKQHKWFKDTFQPEEPISRGLRVGIDRPKLFPELLREMKEYYGLDSRLTRHCIEANIRNNLTSFYNLLFKKKRLEG